MGALVLACGNTAGIRQLPMLTERDDIEVLATPPKPGKAEVDPRLKELAGRRLVVAGTDADLAAVVLRLLRTERLADVVVGFLPADQDGSDVAALWGLPSDPGRALDVAVRGEVEPVPLIRNDAGGVLVGRGYVGPVRGVAYCDDETALRGRARLIEVTPNVEGRAGLAVRVLRGGLLGRGASTWYGRAFQLGCLPSRPVSDGEPHPRPVTRWTWYRHTEDLRAARGPLLD